MDYMSSSMVDIDSEEYKNTYCINWFQLLKKEDVGMAGKIEITEFIEHIKRIKNPANDKYYWNCLDVKVSGSENAPKGLPLPSREIHYTILITDKQREKVESELMVIGKNIYQCKLKIQGEITLDLPFGIIDGEIGVIAYQIKCIDQVVSMEKTISRKTSKVKDIVVPNEFLRTKPRENKLKATMDYYKAQGEMPDPVSVIPLHNQTYYLKDGYIAFLASKILDIEDVWIKELRSSEALNKDGKLLWPLELIEIPNEYLDTVPRQEKLDIILRYINENQMTDKPVETELQPNGLRLLKNGYIRYLAVKQLGYENIWIEN